MLPHWIRRVSMQEKVARLVTPCPGVLELLQVDSWLGHYVRPSVLLHLSDTRKRLAKAITGVLMSQANVLLGASYRLYRHTGMDDTVRQTVAVTTRLGFPRTPWRGCNNASEGDIKGPRHGAIKLQRIRLRCRARADCQKWRALFPRRWTRRYLGDLTTFMNGYCTDADTTFSNDPSDPGTEANPNIQYAGPWRSQPRISTTAPTVPLQLLEWGPMRPANDFCCPVIRDVGGP
ncbi:hypothetical protein EDB86DRAFT_2966877 [Lactarius hatsudake]|nr:hypothetical protein EDB86DRAFT_2966877 [Lactarius hatsudake]